MPSHISDILQNSDCYAICFPLLEWNVYQLPSAYSTILYQMCGIRWLISLSYKTSDWEEWYSQSWTKGTISEETLFSRAALDNQIVNLLRPKCDVGMEWNMSWGVREGSPEKGSVYFVCGRNENNLWLEHKPWLFKTWLQRFLTLLPSIGGIYMDGLMTVSTKRVILFLSLHHKTPCNFCLVFLKFSPNEKFAPMKVIQLPWDHHAGESPIATPVNITNTKCQPCK